MGDSSEHLTSLSLCSGIGGLELGLKRAIGARYRTVCYVEANPYRQRVLETRMREGLLDRGCIWDDIRTFDAGQWQGRIDLVHAGFPCPPFSVAGKRLGADDPRNLWPEVRRTIGEIRPRVVFLENVAGLALRNGAEPAYAWTVLADLAALGYVGRAGIVSAIDAGALHRRDRWWCVGYSMENTQSKRLEGRNYWAEGVAKKAKRLLSPRSGEYVDDSDICPGRHENTARRELQAGPQNTGGIVGNAKSARCQDVPRRTQPSRRVEQGGIPLWPPGPQDASAWERVLRDYPDLAPAIGGKLGVPFVEWLQGFPIGWSECEGATRRLRLEALGDAVVPAQAELAWKLLGTPEGP